MKNKKEQLTRRMMRLW